MWSSPSASRSFWRGSKPCFAARRSARATFAKSALPGLIADFAPGCELRYNDGSRAELSEKESDLLRYLAINSGRAISREELLERVWRINPRGLATRTIDMHVTRLREKLRDDSADPQVVLTVRGKGYMFAGGNCKLKNEN